MAQPTVSQHWRKLARWTPDLASVSPRPAHHVTKKLHAQTYSKMYTMTTTYTYASYHNELNPVKQSSIQLINQPVRTAECSYHCAAIQCYPTLEYRVLLIYPFLQTNITSHMWPSGGKGASNLQDLKDSWITL